MVPSSPGAAVPSEPGPAGGASKSTRVVATLASGGLLLAAAPFLRVFHLLSGMLLWGAVVAGGATLGGIYLVLRGSAIRRGTPVRHNWLRRLADDMLSFLWG